MRIYLLFVTKSCGYEVNVVSLSLNEICDMLRLLLRLWWLQQRRNFSKRDAVVGCYVIFLYIIIGVGFYQGFTESGGDWTSVVSSSVLGLGMVVLMLLPDLLLKRMMKKDVTAMDDYVKSRPIPRSAWFRFLWVVNLMSFWNYVVPVMMLPVFLYFFAVGQAVADFLLLLLLSYLDGVALTFLRLKMYGELKRKRVRLRGFSHVGLFSLQYIGILRAKRVRRMVLLVSAIFLADAYFYALMPMEYRTETLISSSYVTYVVGAVLIPSVTLSQWTFGVEANFFQGLMTKPVRIEQLLTNCFYFYVAVSAVAFVLVLPILLLDDEFSIFVMIGALGLAVFVNLFNLPTCLYSSRLEIFKNTLFGTQKSGMKVNLYAAAFLVPLGLVAAVYHFFGETVWWIVCVALALVSVLVHKWVIAKIAAAFYTRRYERMEKFNV